MYLICISSTQIYRHFNLPVQSLKVNLLISKKNTADLTKVLRIPWDKNRDNLSVVVPEFNQKLITKRNVLSYMVSIYDPPGLISAGHIIGRIFYRELCERKLPWNTEIPQTLKEKF